MTFRNPGSTVDIIHENEKGILLIKRKGEPYKGYWALPGGFLEYGIEGLEEAAKREFEEETSLITELDSLKLIGVYSDPKRDPRGHVIAHVFHVKKVRGIERANDDAAELKRFPLDSLPDLAFDHKKIIDDYVRNWRRNL